MPDMLRIMYLRIDKHSGMSIFATNLCLEFDFINL